MHQVISGAFLTNLSADEACRIALILRQAASRLPDQREREYIHLVSPSGGCHFHVAAIRLREACCAILCIEEPI